MQVGEHLDDALAADELHEVEPVRADVGDGPQGALPAGVEAPVPVSVEEQPVLQVLAADQAGLTDLAGPHEGRGVLVVRVEAGVEAHGVDDPGGGGQGDQLGGLGGVDAERLLADDVLAGGNRRPGLGGVDVVGAGDVHGIEVGDGEQLVERVEGLGQQRVGLAAGAFRGGPDHPDDLDTDAAQRLGVHGSHPSGPDDRRLHCVPRPRRPLLAAPSLALGRSHRRTDLQAAIRYPSLSGR